MPHRTPTTKTHSLSDLVGLIDRDTDTHWTDVIGLDLPGEGDLDEQEDSYTDDRERIRKQYLEAHGDDLYEVTWPTHVWRQAYNSDADYCLITPASGLVRGIAPAQEDLTKGQVLDLIRAVAHANLEAEYEAALRDSGGNKVYAQSQMQGLEGCTANLIDRGDYLAIEDEGQALEITPHTTAREVTSWLGWDWACLVDADALLEGKRGGE